MAPNGTILLAGLKLAVRSMPIYAKATRGEAWRVRCERHRIDEPEALAQLLDAAVSIASRIARGLGMTEFKR
jgi:hypothetical protein